MVVHLILGLFLGKGINLGREQKLQVLTMDRIDLQSALWYCGPNAWIKKN